MAIYLHQIETYFATQRKRLARDNLKNCRLISLTKTGYELLAFRLGDVINDASDGHWVQCPRYMSEICASYYPLGVSSPKDKTIVTSMKPTLASRNVFFALSIVGVCGKKVHNVNISLFVEQIKTS